MPKATHNSSYGIGSGFFYQLSKIKKRFKYTDTKWLTATEPAPLFNKM